MQSNTVETLVGTVVVVVAAVFLYYAYGTVNARQARSGFQVSAEFERIDGISVGTDVRISGIKVGSVVDQTLDPNTFLARIVLALDPKVKIPDDSSVKVAMDGLLGGSYLAIVPGGSETPLKNGGEILNTQPSIDIVGLMGQAIFSPSSNGGGNSGGETAPQVPAP